MSDFRSKNAAAIIVRMTQPLVTFEDVTTIMRLIGELRDDVRKLREFIVEDDGEEEEEPEADG